LGAMRVAGGRMAVRQLSTSGAQQAKVAVVLSGCGVNDGSEVTEAVAALVALQGRGHTVACFAPDKPQAHVIDHAHGQESETSRNVLEESARITRGEITPLSELKAADFEALVVPGGFGAAKNLSDFGFNGADMTVDPEMTAVLLDFHGAAKPMALCCIAPVLAAKVIDGVTVTVGQPDGEQWPFGGAVGAIESFGATHVPHEADGVCIDPANKVVTAPAYMYAGSHHDAFTSVDNMIDALDTML